MTQASQTQANQLLRLRQVADLMLDLRMAELHKSARARAESLAHLSALETLQATDLPLIAAAQATFHYERWAEARRSEINLILSRQTAAWHDAQAGARRAFGQSQVLRSLQMKLRP